MRMRGPVGLAFTRWFIFAIAVASAVVAQEAPKPTFGAVPVAGGELRYEIRGDGPPIVLLSGGFSWIEQPEETFRVLRAFLAPR